MSNMEIGLVIGLATTWIVGGLLIKVAMTKADDAERSAGNAAWDAKNANERAWEATRNLCKLERKGELFAETLGYSAVDSPAKTEWRKK